MQLDSGHEGGRGTQGGESRGLGSGMVVKGSQIRMVQVTGACLPHWGPRLAFGPGSSLGTAGGGKWTSRGSNRYGC